jgi:hypothetical protein
MSRRRKRQCFPIFDAGNSPTRASLYTVDLGTRRNRATSKTVKISPSIDGTPFGCTIVDAETALFIVNGLSAMQMENLSQRGARGGAESEAYLVKREAQDRRDGVPIFSLLDLQPSSHTCLMEYRRSSTGRNLLEWLL